MCPPPNIRMVGIRLIWVDVIVVYHIDCLQRCVAWPDRTVSQCHFDMLLQCVFCALWKLEKRAITHLCGVQNNTDWNRYEITCMITKSIHRIELRKSWTRTNRWATIRPMTRKGTSIDSTTYTCTSNSRFIKVSCHFCIKVSGSASGGQVTVPCSSQTHSDRLKNALSIVSPFQSADGMGAGPPGGEVWIVYIRHSLQIPSILSIIIFLANWPPIVAQMCSIQSNVIIKNPSVRTATNDKNDLILNRDDARHFLKYMKAKLEVGE